MSKLRLLFIKEAQASYISHLDLLRTFQRAFPRTELDIKHSPARQSWRYPWCPRTAGRRPRRQTV